MNYNTNALLIHVPVLINREIFSYLEQENMEVWRGKGHKNLIYLHAIKWPYPIQTRWHLEQKLFLTFAFKFQLRFKFWGFLMLGAIRTETDFTHWTRSSYTGTFVIQNIFGKMISLSREKDVESCYFPRFSGNSQAKTVTSVECDPQSDMISLPCAGRVTVPVLYTNKIICKASHAPMTSLTVWRRQSITIWWKLRRISRGQTVIVT